MKKKNQQYKDLERDFLEFADTAPVSPPAVLNDKIKAAVRRNLAPALWIILSKLAATQAVCATLTLFFCPQFEIGFAGHDYFAKLNQQLGGFGFMLVCGMIFLGSGAAVAPLLFKHVEMEALQKSVLVYFPTAALVAVLFFYSVGADIDGARGLPWFLGGTIGSLMSFELVKYFRFRSHPY